MTIYYMCLLTGSAAAAAGTAAAEAAGPAAGEQPGEQQVTSKQQPIPRPRSRLFMAVSVGEVDSLQNAVDAFKVGGGRGRSKHVRRLLFEGRKSHKVGPVQWLNEDEIFTRLLFSSNRFTCFNR